MKKLALLLIILILPFAIMAQGRSDDAPRGERARSPRAVGGPGPPPGVPIQGLFVLLAAGGLYGYKKLRDYNK
ncbi:hypothetical protein [Aegicerativicinus sediminis]|uniref:hypothetical protein n=1 Tax=Aegicerativicinus sediminis TaxID=2893202 RepID=UPI001E6349EA|nr:hypothetical protein [Aegicerativicinus sediminis]